MKGRILGLDHLGVSVRDPRERLKLWADVLDMPLDRVEAVESEGVRTWFVNMGGPHLELLEPLNDESPIAKALEKRGEGLHHLCLRVDDIEAVLARLAVAGIEPIGGGARPGAGGCTVAFLHPKSTGGILLELSQAPAGAASQGGRPEEERAEAFAEGSIVVAYLREPRERLLGVVRRLDSLGLAIEGFDIEAWDDWMAQRVRGESGPLAPSVQYFPAGRIEKLVADRDDPGLPSFRRRYSERTGEDLVGALSESRE